MVHRFDWFGIESVKWTHVQLWDELQSTAETLSNQLTNIVCSCVGQRHRVNCWSCLKLLSLYVDGSCGRNCYLLTPRSARRPSMTSWVTCRWRHVVWVTSPIEFTTCRLHSRRRTGLNCAKTLPRQVSHKVTVCTSDTQSVATTEYSDGF